MAWAPKVVAKEADRAIRSLMIIDVALSSCHAAVGFGNVHREQPELATAREEPSRDGPVLLLHAVELRKHLVLDELLGRAANEALFLRERSGVHTASGSAAVKSHSPPRRTAIGASVVKDGPMPTFSQKCPAAPIPPPTHMVTMP